MAAPDLAAAHRAADELVSAGVGTVLLFGSLARGDADAPGDIDLVAIFDDLGDYRERSARRADLERRARSASGCVVDVLVTDAPEWEARTKRVPCSTEALIAKDAVTLAEADAHGAIDWDKEIGMPATTTAEMQGRFTNLARAVSDLTESLTPGAQETNAASTGDLTEHAAQELDRFAQACGAAHMVFESAAKITFILTTDNPPPREHRIPDLLAAQPTWVRDAFSAAARSVDLVELARWHEAANYVGDWPRNEYDDAYLRRHTAAAIRIADFAADQCRHLELDDDLLRRFDQRLRNCEAALDGPLRVEA
ncbi:MAG: nucleotidyltransferase domain-containing protein [Acidimicrobiaceae bacterium]|nr:nucleotidyltransferase domain-containing protein [Acidimicrobiaceae bacterium]MDE0497237.1 nucleotidyltransferase domain-containing protein [Acidimicrobiaceae bacterium]